eukprot:CAMPEP_0116940456 /NCGR_PEP_ID=MMETSP0467-20121206/33378_1 /TAXON_ID=283647 /ORGANISM="Mesodinium pulex, Strain SPMC105" /LENGTH=60 /DNA_ID=CAMNT_0004623001 /DNA_START=103 /DNA_END=285 /DNA_ORIENTATION=+
MINLVEERDKLKQERIEAQQKWDNMKHKHDIEMENLKKEQLNKVESFKKIIQEKDKTIDN